MPSVNSAVIFDANLVNLNSIPLTAVRGEIPSLLLDDEEIIFAFSTIRDQVIFTNKRIISINVQGITGKKVMFLSYPYSNIEFYGIQTAGAIDFDSELIIKFRSGAILQFDFTKKVDIQEINNLISKRVL